MGSMVLKGFESLPTQQVPYTGTSFVQSVLHQ